MTLGGLLPSNRPGSNQRTGRNHCIAQSGFCPWLSRQACVVICFRVFEVHSPFCSRTCRPTLDAGQQPQCCFCLHLSADERDRHLPPRDLASHSSILPPSPSELEGSRLAAEPSPSLVSEPSRPRSIDNAKDRTSTWRHSDQDPPRNPVLRSEAPAHAQEWSQHLFKMQSMQRQFGKLMRKGPGDNAKVSMILNDYEDADKVLAQIIDNAKLWRDSWVTLVHSQLQIVTEYEGLYDPIVSASDGVGRESAPTPKHLLEQTFTLRECYDSLKTELLEEIGVIEERILKPATDARMNIAPIRKTIKKREAKRAEYEKLQDKSMKLHKKSGRTPKEDIALAKLEGEMSQAADEFGIADEHLRETLPPVVNACFELIPPLIANVVLIQNRLLGLYYTSLNGYCEDRGFPSPPPPMDDVIAQWRADNTPVKAQLESIPMIARGKGMHQNLNLDGMVAQPQRRTSSGLIASSAPQPRPMRVPSMNSLKQLPEPAEPSPTPSTWKRPDYLAPTDFTTATALGGTTLDHKRESRSPGPSSALTQRGEYFGSTADPSRVSHGGYTPTGSALVKKKPPPPPPPKRIVSSVPDDYVIAQYPFAGQGQGDLSFQEGDRIRVVKRTGTDQDWWVGEVNGQKGSFPANYCKPA
ncbi:hypothetical protein QBC39DRAFT_354498 [Podospora conica]|nr:hypothetical protein QBC39DRAFT_354498 [Schizothecium conicum]